MGMMLHRQGELRKNQKPAQIDTIEPKDETKPPVMGEVPETHTEDDFQSAKKPGRPKKTI